MPPFARSKMRELELKIPPLVEGQKLQQWKVAEMLGVSRDTVNRICIRLGLRTQRTGPRDGDQHPDWQGGVRLVGGYRYIYYPDHPFATKQGYVLEHRLVMEAELKRFLLPHEVVHHRNADRLDNRPANLEVFQSNADHLRHELTGRIPKWTPDGRLRILLGQKNRRRRSGDGRRTRTSRAAS